MNKLKILIIALFLFSLAATSTVFSLGKKTHEFINENIAGRTINEFSLNSYLINQLGFKEGIGESLKIDFDEATVTQWIAFGGKKEDEPLSRSFRHFHNPLKAWNEAGLNAKAISWESSILWAQNSGQVLGGRWSWQDARRYFYEGLTSTDRSEKEKGLAKTFRALGQLMHLVQDASVPAHVRNDIHVFRNYETWLAELQIQGDKKFQQFLDYPSSFDPAILNLPKNPLAPIPIAKIIDADQYNLNGSNPDVTLTDFIGIAEYTNANFFSEDTIGSPQFPHPEFDKLKYDDYFIPDPRDTNSTVRRKYYIYKKTGDRVRLKD